jgi:hypothetical protein
VSEKLTNMLEDKLNKLSGDLGGVGSSNLPINSFMDEEEQIAIEEFKAQFEKDKAEIGKTAKKLLTDIMHLFFEKDIIDKYEYIKSKNDIDNMTLSGLLFQLNTSHRAIEKLCQDIALGHATNRTYEVLSYLQRVVLDISKFQASYFEKLEESYRSIREEIDQKEMELAIESGGDMSGNDIIVSTRDKRKLIDELKEIGETVLELQKRPSHNANLSKEVDDKDYIIKTKEEIEIEQALEEEGSGTSLNIEGFDGY